MNNLSTIKSRSFHELKEEVVDSSAPGPRNPDLNTDQRTLQVIAEDQEKNLSDQKEKRLLMKKYRKFNKAKSTDKFRAFITWVEREKALMNESTFYWYLKDYYFSTKMAAIHLFQESEIFCLAVTHDQNTLIVGCADKKIHLWSLIPDYDWIVSLEGHQAQIAALVASKTVMKLYSGGYDGKVKVWNLDERVCEATFEDNNEPVLALALSEENHWLVSGSQDESIIIRNLENHQIERKIKIKGAPVDSLAVVPNTYWVASGHWDHKIRIWDVLMVKEEPYIILEGHRDLVRCLVISPNGKYLISGSVDRSIRIWDLDALQKLSPKEITSEFSSEKYIIKVFEGHTDVIRNLFISSDGKYLLSGSYDKTVRKWDLKTLRLSSVLEGHADKVRAVLIAETYDGAKIISGCSDKIIRMWRMKEEKDKHFLMGHNEKIWELAVWEENQEEISPKNKRQTKHVLSWEKRKETFLEKKLQHSPRFYSCGPSGLIFVWDLSQQKIKTILDGHAGTVNSFVVAKFKADHPWLISGGADCKVIKWCLKTNTIKAEFLGHRSSVVKVCYFDEKVVSASLDQTIRVWKVVNGDEVSLIDHHPGTIISLEILEWKRMIASGTKEHLIFLWRLDKPEFVQKIEVRNIGIIKSVNSLNGFVVGCYEDERRGSLKIWDIQEGRWSKTLDGHEGPILAGKVIGKGERLITGSTDKTIRIWDLKTGKQIGISANSKIPITALEVFDNESQLLYPYQGKDEEMIRIRRINKIKTLNILRGAESSRSILCLDVSRDEKYLVSATDENLIDLWDFKNMRIIGSMKGHSHKIYKVKISTDNAKVVSGSADNTIRVWDRETRSTLRILKGSSHKVTCLHIFSNNSKILSGSYDSFIRMWNIEKTDQNDDKACYVSSQVTALTLSDDETRFFAAGLNLNITIGDLVKFRKVSALETEMNRGHKKVITALVYTKEELSHNEARQRLISGSLDRTVKIWDLWTESLIVTLEINYEVHSMDVNKLKTKLSVGLERKYIELWDLHNFKRIGELEGHSSSVNVVKILSSSRRMVSGGKDNKIRVWDLNDVEKRPFLEGHSHTILALAPFPDQKRIISLASDKKLIVWDLNSGRQLQSFQKSSVGVSSLAISHDGSKAVVSTFTNEVLIWEIETEELILNMKTKSAIKSLIVSTDNNYLYLGCCDSFIRVMDIKDGRIVKELEKHTGVVKGLCFDLTARKLISSSDDTTIIIWDIESSKVIRILEGHDNSVNKVLLTKNNKRLISGGDDRKVIIWDFETFEKIKILEDHPEPVKTLALSLDENRLFVGCCPEEKEAAGSFVAGYWLDRNYEKVNPKVFKPSLGCRALAMVFDNSEKLIASSDKNIIIWNCQDWSFKELNGYSNKITFEHLTEDNHLIFVTDDNIISLWDLETSKKVAEFKGHTDNVNACLMTFDSKVLISASSDKTIRLWGIEEKKELAILQGHSNAVNSIVLYRDEKLISSSNDKSIRIWDIMEKKCIRVFSSLNDQIACLKIIKEEWVISAGKERSIKLWNMNLLNSGDKCDYFAFTGAIVTETIENIVVSPDEQLLLVITSNSKLQVWRMNYDPNERNSNKHSQKNEAIGSNPWAFEMLNETEIINRNFHSLPVFLSETNPRLVFYFNKIFDCYNGNVIFTFQIFHDMISFYLNPAVQKIKYYYLSNHFELYEMGDFWLNNYIYMYLTYDSLHALPKDDSRICDRKQSTFPFFLSFLHLSSIFEKKDYFSLEKMEEIYADDLSLNHFYQVDIFLNTPLDILIMQKNTNLIFKYFELLFEVFDWSDVPFHQKVRFLNYRFKDFKQPDSQTAIKEMNTFNQSKTERTSSNTNTTNTAENLPKTKNDILDLLGAIIDVCEDDYMILNRLLECCYLELDSRIYANDLVYDEMDDPILVEADSFYTIDKNWIENKLRQEFKKKGEKNSIVKCKVICLPGLNDISNENTSKIISHLADGDCMNNIFCNDVLCKLMIHIWKTQIQSYYWIETVIFVIFFLMFNLNFLYFYKNRSSDEEDFSLESVSITIDILIMIYSLYCASNEFGQMKYWGLDYFDSIWNFFDIILIPLMMGSSLLDIYIIFHKEAEQNAYIKLVFAICMFCFWFRSLSFFRSVKETSSMMRLILNVMAGVRYFLMFMILFMLTLSTTFMVLINDTDNTLWETFYDIYKSTVGDYDAIEDYSTDNQLVNQIILIASTFLFAIILLNLLVAILGDKHEEIKEAEEKTRLYELTNIIEDTNSAILTQTLKKIRPPPKRGQYLVCLYNEKHEKKKVNEFEGLEKKFREKFDGLEERVERIEEKMTENFDKIMEYINERREKKK